MRTSRPLLSFIMSSSCLLAQASWSQLYPTLVPAPRQGAAMACFEPAGECWMLFGSSPTTGPQVWRFVANTWSTAPSPAVTQLSYPAMVYDASRQRLVLFGGGVVGGQSNNVFEWNGTVWSNPNPPLRPSPRQGHGMAFDRARGVTVVFGGLAVIGGIETHFGDVWEWNGTVWQQRMATAPFGNRYDAKLAFDPVRRDVVLFGGTGQAFGTTVLFNDTWSWDGTVWSQRTPATPPTMRYQAAMVTDLARSRVVLHGGNQEPYAWEWDGSEWHLQVMASPSQRMAHCMAWDAVQRRVVLFGGLGGTAATNWFNDTWSYRTLLPADVVPFGSGCAGSAGTPSLANAPYVFPWLGDTMRDIVGNVPAASLGAIFVSSFGTTPPVSLDFLGMPGCTALVPLDTAEFRAANAGQAEWSLLLPNSIALAGVQFRQQAYVLDAAANAFGLTASNAVTVTLGVR